MLNALSRSTLSLIVLTLGVSVGAIAPVLTSPSAKVLAQDSTDTTAIATSQTTTTQNTALYPDIQNHWAQPFIRTLTQQNILAGYPDGNFRPDRPMERDEFAAVIRQAFDQNRVRNIASGSAFNDVPEGYWAAPAIQEAYEMGFMSANNGNFRPRESISKVDAIVALARNLNLSNALPQQAVVAPSPATPQSTAQAPQSTQSAQSTTQAQTPAQRRRANTRPLLFPLAMTSLAQPLMTALAPVSNAVAVPAPSQPQAQAPSDPAGGAAASQSPAAQPPTNQIAAADIIRNYYRDADQIPQEAVNDVAQATQAGVVVNYPEPQILGPSQPATRAEVAALVHQALVDQGRLAPIPNNEAARNYIVNP